MRVVLGDLDAERVADAAASIADHDGAVGVQLDVRDPESVERTADVAEALFGGIHVAVNHAGVINGGTTWELTPAEWREVLDVNSA
jgi:NAD(P)-dependent dehydrogenase (short-subunit alcohol dehydrogenase family)